MSNESEDNKRVAIDIKISFGMLLAAAAFVLVLTAPKMFK
jgi:dipeptide/tripeptide permease